MIPKHIARLTLLLAFLALPAAAFAAGAAAGTAPGFKLPTRAGTVALDSLRGRVVLVDFWASWCGPCRRSFPWMTTLEQRYAAKGLTIVAINLDKTREAANEFLAEFATPFTVAFDPSGKTAESYQVSGLPMTFLVGRDGKILYAHVGFDPKKTEPLENLIKEACP